MIVPFIYIEGFTSNGVPYGVMDEDSGRYLLRKSDSSGEFFISPGEITEWNNRTWTEDAFIYRE
jgi:hypothetical protein